MWRDSVLAFAVIAGCAAPSGGSEATGGTSEGDADPDDSDVPSAGEADDSTSAETGSETEPGADSGSTTDCSLESEASGVDRRVSNGILHGSERGEVFSFKGVPYAQPPTGPLRWRAPEPAQCSAEPVMAEVFGSKCPQLQGGSFVGDEDCLTLNVWTPAAGESTDLPVLVFLHGGFNVRGSSDAEAGGIFAYDGESLAQRGAVVITINYRLGALGFLVHPSLDTDDGGSGNYALMDQLEALRWVQINASAFGGDATRVMLFGQSAGSIDSCALLASPHSDGLFSRVMMLSGACTALTRPDAESIGGQVAAALDCDTEPFECLHATPAEALINTVTQAGLDDDLSHVVVDGTLVPGRPNASFAAGVKPLLPTIVSTTTQEMKQALANTMIASEQDYQAAIALFFGDANNTAGLQRLALVESPPLPEDVLAAYPSADFESFNDAFTEVLTDLYYTCPARRTLRALVAGGNATVWQGVFAHAFDDPLLAQYGASHGYDLFFGFGNFGLFGQIETPEEVALSDRMQAHWLDFAATGDPGRAWPRFSDDEQYLVHAVESTAASAYRTNRCDFWDELLPAAAQTRQPSQVSLSSAPRVQLAP